MKKFSALANKYFVIPFTITILVSIGYLLDGFQDHDLIVILSIAGITTLLTMIGIIFSILMDGE